MSQQDITLHKAQETDIDMMTDMRILFATELTGKLDAAAEEKMRTYSHEYFIAELNKTCLCWYASVNGEPVSTIMMILRRQPGNLKNPTGKWGYVMNVFTLPAFRKKGISSLLLNKIIEEAASLGYTAFELHATKDGEPVYLKNGFVLHPEPTYRKILSTGE